MKRFWSEMNPTLRGFLLIAVIALLVMALNLYVALATAEVLLRIAFFLAIAFVLYLLWRDRVREDAETWPRHARFAFYGGAALIVIDLGLYFWRRDGLAGLDAVAFVLVLALSGFAMFRVWRDQHTYS